MSDRGGIVLGLSLILFFILTVSGVVYLECTREKPVSSGKIVEKHHEDATRSSMMFCAPKRGCFPMSHYVPEHWVFILEDCRKSSGTCRKGEVEVNKEVYNGFEVGDQYPSPEFPGE